MSTVSLREFTLSVSTCLETTCLSDVWQLFQAGHALLVVLNGQQVPLGVLHLQDWIQHGLRSASPFDRPLEDAARGAWSLGLGDGGSISIQTDTDIEVVRFVLTPDRTVDQMLEYLEPVGLLPADWSVEQFQPYLTIDQQWVLVNAVGQYVGLLDRLRLFQFFAVRGAAAAPSASAPAVLKPAGSDGTPADAIPLITATPAIDPLIDLLERIPVPLMLQTSNGRIITQNLVWRQQVSHLQDPGQLGQEAAVILEASDREEDEAESAAAVRRASPTFDLDGLQVDGGQRRGHSTPRSAGICRLSSEPNGCVCVCPMKNGQERIWKFLKVPMGMATVPLSQQMQDWQPADFKLATLGFSPDPEWRSLAQTEFLWLILAQDITEQQQIAKELAAKNADLVQLNRLKDEFLSCISHELKTPLTAVLGLSSLLKDQALGKLNERQSRYARLIHQSGRHLISIVNDILDLTRIETGQMELMLEAVPIATICHSAYQQACQMHAVEGYPEADNPIDPVQRFQLQVRDNLMTLIADELRLRQMLCHLLSNALKFTDPAGDIGLRVEKWEGWIAFTVWDTGIGIPIDKQHLIFQKFQQLESPLTRQFEGTGLGLVLTQRLARLHGGDITFTSIEGKGSEFTLLLPPSPPQSTAGLTEDAKRQTPSASPNLITSKNRLMLVVESDPQLIERLSHHILELGYRVAIARSGTEALEKIRRLQPAIIFLNPLLPLLSGWDVLTLLKTDDETQHIPVVITATRADREQASQNGANAFLGLPIRADALQRSIDRLLAEVLTPADSGSPAMTVLYLNGSPPASAEVVAGSPVSSTVQDLTSLLHPHHCRVLEVEDMEQADLLAQVWNPNVILVGGEFADPVLYIQQLSFYPKLATLPIVTLTAEITHAANLLPGLSVFPCLLAVETPIESSAEPSPGSALWQVIQMAAGIHWTPHILIADVSALEEAWVADTPSDLSQQIHAMLHPVRPLNATQALVHYMQSAGFCSSVGHSWQQVVQQLEHHSVDLLLLCVYSSSNLHPLFLDILQTIEQLNPKPPILVWNCRTGTDTPSNSEETQQLARRWGTIATEILPASLSVPELLARIKQTLTDY
jgi:signal transduction histidine kinase/DNA-binding response OmpR family regulator